MFSTRSLPCAARSHPPPQLPAHAARTCGSSRCSPRERFQPCTVLTVAEKGVCEPPSQQTLPAEASHRQSHSWWDVVSGTTTSVTSQILGSVRFWPYSGKSPAVNIDESQAQLSPTDQVLHEAARRTKEEQKSTKPVDITQYLRLKGKRSTAYARQLASLTALTYQMHKLTPRGLQRRHKNLELISTSKACERCHYEHSKTAEEVAVEADGMAAALPDVESQYGQVAPVATASNIVALPRDLKFGTITPKNWATPAELVQQKLQEAASLASAVAMSPINSAAQAMSPINSAAQQLVKATQNLVVSKTVEQYTASKTIADAVSSSSKAAVNIEEKRCPSEWFVCDDKEKQLRYFVIQGSDTVDHWVTNLTFEPIMFEDPALGVKVHRGVYAAALSLYERFLPLVQEQLESLPMGKVCFTGHSIGGSLAMLLMLMYVRRGVLPPDRVAPVYTFGAPAIFCEGALGGCSANCGNCSLDRPRDAHDDRTLLAMLGLRTDDVVNVMMHRDLVPRAFACDYSPVADILKGWGPSFREHCCLGGDLRPLLYNFIGRMVVLQPEAHMGFVAKEPYHPMLPQHGGLWELRALPHHQPQHGEAEDLPTNAARSLREAVLALMDNPHPLEILYDRGAYGPSGSISRYHNPDNYTRALAALIRNTASPAGKSREGSSRNGDQAAEVDQALASHRSHDTPKVGSAVTSHQSVDRQQHATEHMQPA